MIEGATPSMCLGSPRQGGHSYSNSRQLGRTFVLGTAESAANALTDQPFQHASGRDSDARFQLFKYRSQMFAIAILHGIFAKAIDADE